MVDADVLAVDLAVIFSIAAMIRTLEEGEIIVGMKLDGKWLVP